MLKPARVIASVLAAGVMVLAGCGNSGPVASPTTIAPSSTTAQSGAVLSTAAPPWGLPANASAYIGAAGLQALSHETLAVHYHAHLDIIDNGRSVAVPGGVGFVIVNGHAVALTSLHTHDSTGIIHIEAPINKPFTLGQFFTEWGVQLADSQLGGLVSNGGQELRLYVDGARQSGAPQQLALRPHQEIVLWYGPVAQNPKVPDSYNFPPGD